jgi:hypothetical protein
MSFPENLGESLGERPTFNPGDRVVWMVSDGDPLSGTVLEIETNVAEFATVRLDNGKQLDVWVGDLRHIRFA